MCPFRPNPLAPFPAREGGKFGGGEVSLRVGPKTLANPQLTGVGKGGPGGRSPHGGGLWGVSPHKFKRGGEAPTLTNPLRVGPRTLANLQPTGVGTKGGPGGTSPLAGGVGDVKGGSSQPLQPCHEWDPKRWQTLSLRGWVQSLYPYTSAAPQ